MRTPTPSPTRTAVPQQVEEKDAQLIQPNAEVLRLEKEVQKAGFLTINHGYDPKNTAEVAVRAPSIVAPSGYTLMPMTISASVVCNGNGVALIPCPRDIIDQTHLGTFVEVSNKEGKVDVESEIIYSAPNKNGIGYVNPYVKVHLKGVRFQGPLSITVLHYVIVPSYPSITERELVQKMGPQATLELQRAARAGTAVKWTPKTDCRVKALAAAGAVKNGVEPLQGYIYGRDETKKNQIYQTYPQYGAAHYINAVFSPAGALVMDPTTPQDCYVGPQLEFVATSVGAQDNLPAWSSRPIEGANRGIFHGVGKNIGKAVFSTPGFGKEGDWLKQVKPPLVIQQFAQSLWQLRQNNAYGRNVAGNN